MPLKNFRTFVGVKNLTPYFCYEGIFYPIIGYAFQMHPLKTPKAAAFTLLIGYFIPTFFWVMVCVSNVALLSCSFLSKFNFSQFVGKSFYCTKNVRNKLIYFFVVYLCFNHKKVCPKNGRTPNINFIRFKQRSPFQQF